MSLRVYNQKPGVLNPIYKPKMNGAFDVHEYMDTVFQPLFRNPLVPSSPVDITLNNASINDDYIYDIILNCCTDIVNSQSEDICRKLFAQTLQYFNPKTKLLAKDVFAISSGTAAGLDEPDAVTIYTPSTDIIPVASKFLTGAADYDEFFATFAYYCRFEAFGVYFVNNTAFEDFKTWFQNSLTGISGNLTSKCNSLINDFMKLTLTDLTESFKIRNNNADNIDEWCFARVLISHLMAYFNTTKLAGPMPFDIGNWFCPKNIVFVNVERFAHSSASAVAHEIEDINKAIGMTRNITMISNNKLAKLAPVARQLRRNQATMALALNASKNHNRACRTKFKSRIMTNKEYLINIKKILDRMKTDRITQNVYKKQKPSFAKPNRRDPDNFNLQGKIMTTAYHPDIHLYLDTSGSISEDNYKASVKLAIQLAKKLNVNLYFNSFSHEMSQTTLLHCQNKSVNDIYRKFANIPKVTGGTNFEQIWHFINGNQKREDELSLIITDFCWCARSAYIKHPKNLYYMPCANMNWNDICNAAKDFIKSCEHNDPDIRSHILA